MNKGNEKVLLIIFLGLLLIFLFFNNQNLKTQEKVLSKTSSIQKLENGTGTEDYNQDLETRDESFENDFDKNSIPDVNSSLSESQTHSDNLKDFVHNDNEQKNSDNVLKNKDDLYASDDIIYGDNYLKYAAQSDGSIVKWNKKIISVYIYDSEYNDVIIKAFKKYNTIFSNYFAFKRAQKPNLSDVVVAVVKKFDTNDNPNNVIVMGVTNNQTDNRDKSISLSKIKLLSVHPVTGKPIKKQDMYVTVLHEIGHALGIVGHSPNVRDLMHPVSGANSGTFTSRDRITLKMMYSGNASVISRETGDSMQAKLKEAEEYVKMSPNHAISWVSLAREYYNSGEKEKALNAYKKAIEIEPNNPMIYQSMAESYYFSKKYDTAIKYYKRALINSKEGSAKVSINNMIGVCYSKKDDYESAYPYFKSAYLSRSNDKKILLNLLGACVATQRKEDALLYIQKYKNLGNDIKNENEIQSVIKWAKK